MGFKNFPEKVLVESQHFLSASSKDMWPQCAHSLWQKKEQLPGNFCPTPMHLSPCPPSSTPPVLSVFSLMPCCCPPCSGFSDLLLPAAPNKATAAGFGCHGHCLQPLTTPQQLKPRKSLNLPVSLFTARLPAWVWLSHGRHFQHKIPSLLPSAEVSWASGNSFSLLLPTAPGPEWGGLVRWLRLPPQGYQDNTDTSAETANVNETMQPLVSDNLKKKKILFLMSVVENVCVKCHSSGSYSYIYIFMFDLHLIPHELVRVRGHWSPQLCFTTKVVTTQDMGAPQHIHGLQSGQKQFVNIRRNS